LLKQLSSRTAAIFSGGKSKPFAGRAEKPYENPCIDYFEQEEDYLLQLINESMNMQCNYPDSLSIFDFILNP
jgi:hypothetical protein